MCFGIVFAFIALECTAASLQKLLTITLTLLREAETALDAKSGLLTDLKRIDNARDVIEEGPVILADHYNTAFTLHHSWIRIHAPYP